jgi:hypothetical protein
MILICPCLRNTFTSKKKNYHRSIVAEIMERMAQYAHIGARTSDMEARIWYPAKRRTAEYLIVGNSYFPAIWYYLVHLRD